MKTLSILVVIISLTLSVEGLYAQRTVVKTPRRTVVHSPRGTVVYRNPVVVRPVTRLPASAVAIHYRNTAYYFNAGVFYASQSGAYVRVAPPVGIRLAVLPAGYARVVTGTVPYYYYSGIFYTSAPGNEYVVVEAPVGAVIETVPAEAVAIELEGQKCVEYNGVIYRPVYRDGKKYYEVVGQLEE